MCGTGTKNATTTNTSTPPAQVLQNYETAWNMANSAASRPFQPYTGQMTANLTPAQMSAFNTVDTSQGLQSPFYAKGANDLNWVSDYFGGNSNTNAASLIGNYETNLFANPYMPQIAQAAGGLNPYQYNQFSNPLNQQAAPYNQQVAQASGPVSANSINNMTQQFMNPFTQDVVGQTMKNINESNQQQQQQILGNAESSGAFGGDRQAIAQTELARQQDLASGQTIANLENAGYTQAQQTAAGLGQFNAGLGLQGATTLAQLEAQRQQTAAGLAQGSANLGLMGASEMGQLGAQSQMNALNLTGQQGQEMLNAAQMYGGLGQGALQGALSGASAQMQSGAIQQAQNQALLNNELQQFYLSQQYPFQTSSFLGNLAEGLGANWGGTTTGQVPQGNLFSELGGLGIAGLGLSSLFTPSDVRSKENMIPIGKTYDDQPIYRFNYRGESPQMQRIGLVAQEVQQKHPEAVHTMLMPFHGVDGLLGVDYGKATEGAARKGHFAYGGRTRFDDGGDAGGSNSDNSGNDDPHGGGSDPTGSSFGDSGRASFDPSQLGNIANDIGLQSSSLPYKGPQGSPAAWGGFSPGALNAGPAQSFTPPGSPGSGFVSPSIAGPLSQNAVGLGGLRNVASDLGGMLGDDVDPNSGATQTDPRLSAFLRGIPTSANSDLGAIGAAMGPGALSPALSGPASTFQPYNGIPFFNRQVSQPPSARLGPWNLDQGAGLGSDSAMVQTPPDAIDSISSPTFLLGAQALNRANSVLGLGSGQYMTPQDRISAMHQMANGPFARGGRIGFDDGGDSGGDNSGGDNSNSSDNSSNASDSGFSGAQAGPVGLGGNDAGLGNIGNSQSLGDALAGARDLASSSGPEGVSPDYQGTIGVVGGLDNNGNAMSVAPQGTINPFGGARSQIEGDYAQSGADFSPVDNGTVNGIPGNTAGYIAAMQGLTPGMPQQAQAALLGNWNQESGAPMGSLYPNSVNYINAFGIAQDYDPGRQAAMLSGLGIPANTPRAQLGSNPFGGSYNPNAGLLAGTTDAQIAGNISDLNKNFPGLTTNLMNSNNSLATDTAAIARQFENPGEADVRKSLSTRTADAGYFNNAMNTLGPFGTPNVQNVGGGPFSFGPTNNDNPDGIGGAVIQNAAARLNYSAVPTNAPNVAPQSAPPASTPASLPSLTNASFAPPGGVGFGPSYTMTSGPAGSIGANVVPNTNSWAVSGGSLSPTGSMADASITPAAYTAPNLTPGESSAIGAGLGLTPAAPSQSNAANASIPMDPGIMAALNTSTQPQAPATPMWTVPQSNELLAAPGFAPTPATLARGPSAFAPGAGGIATPAAEAPAAGIQAPATPQRQSPFQKITSGFNNAIAGLGGIFGGNQSPPTTQMGPEGAANPTPLSLSNAMDFLSGHGGTYQPMTNGSNGGLPLPAGAQGGLGTPLTPMAPQQPAAPAPAPAPAIPLPPVQQIQFGVGQPAVSAADAVSMYEQALGLSGMKRGGRIGRAPGGIIPYQPAPTPTLPYGQWNQKPAGPFAGVPGIPVSGWRPPPMLSPNVPDPLNQLNQYSQMTKLLKAYSGGNNFATGGRVGYAAGGRVGYDNGGMTTDFLGGQFGSTPAPAAPPPPQDPGAGGSPGAPPVPETPSLSNNLFQPTQQDRALALMSAGFGMMSSKSPFALQGIGEGAQQGVNFLMNARAQEREAAKAQSDINYQAGMLKNRGIELQQQGAYQTGELALGNKRAQAEVELQQAQAEQARMAAAMAGTRVTTVGISQFDPKTRQWTVTPWSQLLGAQSGQSQQPGPQPIAPPVQLAQGQQPDASAAQGLPPPQQQQAPPAPQTAQAGPTDAQMRDFLSRPVPSTSVIDPLNTPNRGALPVPGQPPVQPPQAPGPQQPRANFPLPGQPGSVWDGTPVIKQGDIPINTAAFSDEGQKSDLETTKTITDSAEKAYEASQGMNYNLDLMQQNLAQLPKNGFLAPGTGAQTRQNVAAMINTIADSLGIDDPEARFDDNAVASGQLIKKISTKLGFDLAKTLGSREAQMIVQQAIGTVPGADNTPLGAQRIIGALRGAAQYQQDKYLALNNWKLQNGGSAAGFDNWFNKVRPPSYYSARAVVSTVDPAARQALLAGKGNDTATAFDAKYGSGSAALTLGVLRGEL